MPRSRRRPGQLPGYRGRRIDRHHHGIAGRQAGASLRSRYQAGGPDRDELPERHGCPRLLTGAGGPACVSSQHLMQTSRGCCRPGQGLRRSRRPGRPAAVSTTSETRRTAPGGRRPVRPARTKRVRPGSASPRGAPAPGNTHTRRGRSRIDAGRLGRRQTPDIYIGSVIQIRLDLQARRERSGPSYLIASDHDLPTLAAIIAGLSRQRPEPWPSAAAAVAAPGRPPRDDEAGSHKLASQPS